MNAHSPHMLTDGDGVPDLLSGGDNYRLGYRCIHGPSDGEGWTILLNIAEPIKYKILYVSFPNWVKNANDAHDVNDYVVGTTGLWHLESKVEITPSIMFYKVWYGITRSPKLHFDYLFIL
jgi:hypothetical protein